MTNFQELGIGPDLIKAVEEMGFENPTQVQEKVIPQILNTQRDIIGLAQTGTGKTAAFGLPLIEETDIDDKSVQALVIAPTRELCVQIAGDLKNYSHHTPGLSVVAVYGGASIEMQIRELRRGAHIIAATPGRMVDLLKRKAVNISKLRTLVLDEADEMLNMGFRDELDKILETTPEDKRTLLFSATMPAEVARIASRYMTDALTITVGRQNSGAENVRHIYYQVHARDRYAALKRIADINPNIYGIVFCRTRRETQEVADKLIKDGYNADALHGDLSQAQRDHVMNRFRERNLQMLVATDVAARGIDVNDITHVINYNLPDEAAVYTHRTGRTGRADKSGIAISIVNYREKSRIPQLEKMLGKKFEKRPVPSGEEICKKQLFNLIDRMEKVVVDEDQIAPFMDTVNKKLEWLSKEDIIKHFVSLEFNRFLEYYKNAPDLNKGSEGKSREKKTRFERGKKSRRQDYNENFTRFFINVGRKDRIAPQNIIGIVNDYSGDRNIIIGDIDIKDSFSFFEADSAAASKILKNLKGKEYKNRTLMVEIADDRKSSKARKNTGKRKDKNKKHRKN